MQALATAVCLIVGIPVALWLRAWLYRQTR